MSCWVASSVRKAVTSAVVRNLAVDSGMVWPCSARRGCASCRTLDMVLRVTPKSTGEEVVGADLALVEGGGEDAAGCDEGVLGADVGTRAQSRLPPRCWCRILSRLSSRAGIPCGSAGPGVGPSCLLVPGHGARRGRDRLKPGRGQYLLVRRGRLPGASAARGQR